MTTTRLSILSSFCLVLALACDKSTAPEGSAPAKGASKSAGGDAGAKEAATPSTDASASAALVDPVAKAAVGQPAPDFTLSDLDGKAVKLSEHRGKIVVLEWFNPGCPFVKYAHGEGPLKDMAAKETKNGVVWIAVNSGAPGKEGAGADNSREAAKAWGMSHPILIDDSGVVGKTYGAAKTPHMFIVDDKGTLVYAGGLDNAPMGEVDGDAPKVSYVEQALADLRGGKPVAPAQTKAYGCSVKYAS
jgi:peroxiredoxin